MIATVHMIIDAYCKCVIFFCSSTVEMETDRENNEGRDRLEAEG